MQERLEEEIRLREIQPAPLGFNHKTRARLRAASHAQDPTPLIQEMQQEQQQKVPSSIIIGPNGSQVNY
jgi:predicted nucleic acid-binding Zn ribbon protein